MRSVILLAGCLLLALVPMGCGGNGPKKAPVSGRITMGNRPLADATVTFVAGDTTPGKAPLEASGKTDEQGAYSLKGHQDNSAGLPPGTYKVHISLFDRGTDTRPPRGQLIPPAYSRNSRLTFTVTEEGSTSANFDVPRPR
jgi:hypothetical protein